MRILYVTKAVKPNKGGSVSICENLIKYFTSDEMVVIGSRRLFSKKCLRQYSKVGVNFYYQFGEINFRGKGDRFLVPLRYMLFPFLVWRIIRVYQKERCDHILANFPDIFFCYAAYLAANILGSDYSTYFHNTYLENRPGGYRGYFAKKWQPKIFDRSRHIFVMSEGMKSFYKNHYSSKYNFVTLPHTYSYQIKDTAIKKISEPVKLVFIGNFNDSNIEATRRVIDALKIENRYEFYFYTHVPNILLKSRGLDVTVIKNMGFIDESKLIDEIRKYDISILTHGFTGSYSEVEYQTIFPTRTIPLLLAGIPLFVHSPDNSFLTQFIKFKECAELVKDADHNKIQTTVNDLVNNRSRQEQIVRNALQAAKAFDGQKIAANLKTEIRRVY